MNSTAWRRHFESNRLHREEPHWHWPFPENESIAIELGRSLSHFALGESGEGNFLRDRAKQSYPDDPDYITALELFVQEEAEHARLLLKLVARFGGQPITRHWTHSCFRLLRRGLGVHFEIQVLVIAELVGTAYYRLLRIRARDGVLEQVCNLILRDEVRHIEFHSDRFADLQKDWLPLERALWETQFQSFFLVATGIAWLDHRRALQAVGAKRSEFFREARRQCIAFLETLSRPMCKQSTAQSS